MKKAKQKEKATLPLVSHVPENLKKKFQKLTFAEGSTPSQTIREMVESYCEDQ